MSDEYEGDADDAPEPRKVFWQGRQWCVTDYGIETVERDRYYIEAERLGDLTDGRDRDVRPGAERLRHTGGKTWVDIEDLGAAFAVALQVHAGKFPALPDGAFHNTLADLRWSKISNGVYRELVDAAGGEREDSFGPAPILETGDEMDRRYPDRSRFYEVIELPASADH